jgi:deoxyadenosine/deoxycytidine kinase
MLADSGDLDPMEFDLYKNLYAHISKMIPPTSAHIWVNVPPEVCFERTKLRGREGEEAIPLSYFQDLHTVHERWLRNTSVSVCEATTVQEVESFIATLVREGVGQV